MKISPSIATPSCQIRQGLIVWCKYFNIVAAYVVWHPKVTSPNKVATKHLLPWYKQNSNGCRKYKITQMMKPKMQLSFSKCLLCLKGYIRVRNDMLNLIYLINAALSFIFFIRVPKLLCWCTGMLAISRHFVYYRAVKIKQSSEWHCKSTNKIWETHFGRRLFW